MPAHDVTRLAHEWIVTALSAGATAVDATAGSGQDTLFLAQSVGRTGNVHAFDVQARAIDRARATLQDRGLADRVSWHLACHSTAGEWLDGAPLDAVMFNLGWLPGGDHSLTTRPRNTVAALATLAVRLRPGGRLSVVAYRGHPGGEQEGRAVASWFERPGIPAHRPRARPASASPRAPVLHVLERTEAR